jgi:hypothetical protein
MRIGDAHRAWSDADRHAAPGAAGRAQQVQHSVVGPGAAVRTNTSAGLSAEVFRRPISVLQRGASRILAPADAGG